MSANGAARGQNGRAIIVAFAVSFLIWPALNGILRPFSAPALELFGILEVLPTLAGGLTGMLLERSNVGAWWVIMAAVGAVGVTAVGPPR
jgi:peptidoglycan/LPS O-acetylase OafA/YrhL